MEKKSDQKQYEMTQYYSMDKIVGIKAFNEIEYKKTNWFINHMSDRFQFPNGEVTEIFDGETTWWMSSDPLSLFATMIHRQDPMYYYYIIMQSDDSVCVYNQERLIGGEVPIEK